MQTITKIKPYLNPKQKEAMRILMDHTNGVTEILYGGAGGGGKSYLGCLFLTTNAIKYANTRWLIGGKELKKLKQSIIATFYEMAGHLSLVEGYHFNYSEHKGEIKFYNGSIIILMDLADRPTDPDFHFLGSIPLTGAYLEEVARISKKAKDMVMSRIRFGIDENGISPKLLMSCNPTKNWLYNDYYKPYVDGKLLDYRRFIQAFVTDNPKISKHYITNLSRMDSITISRLRDGSWDYQDDLALFDYDALNEMFDFPEYYQTPEECDKYFSIDVAHLGKDNTAIFVWENLNVVEIVELSKQTFTQQLTTIQTLQFKYGISNQDIIIDLDGLSAGLYDLLPGAKGIHNNGKTISGADFQNIKTQMYYKLAELINSKQIKIKCNEDYKIRLMQELQVVKRENVDSDGKIQMTNKDSIKKLIGRSPDLSDAMAYRMYPVLIGGDFDYGFMI